MVIVLKCYGPSWRQYFKKGGEENRAIVEIWYMHFVNWTQYHKFTDAKSFPK